MDPIRIDQQIGQLEPKKGSYYYLEVSSKIVEQLPLKRKTRLICKLDNQHIIRCGLNHLGDGNFFVIIAGKYLSDLNKTVGDPIQATIYPDPNPLGVDIPEVLEVLMDQDSQVREVFESLSDGKKRSLIFSIAKIKNVDLKVEKVLRFVNEQLYGTS